MFDFLTQLVWWALAWLFHGIKWILDELLCLMLRFLVDLLNLLPQEWLINLDEFQEFIDGSVAMNEIMPMAEMLSMWMVWGALRIGIWTIHLVIRLFPLIG